MASLEVNINRVVCILILVLIQWTVPQNGQSVTNQVSDTAGGGVGTGAIIGIAVGVVAFLIIIIAVVCFFVCRQMAQQKEEKMRHLQPSVFTTASSRQQNPPSSTQPNTSGSQPTARQASIRRSPHTKRFLPQGVENRAYSETSNNSTDFVASKMSYAIMSDTSVGGKSSIRMHNLHKGEQRNGSVRRDRSDKALSDDARSSVKFDLRSESQMGKVSAPKFGKGAKNVPHTSASSVGPRTMPIRSSQNKENDPQTIPKAVEAGVVKPKKSTTEGKGYFREYVNKGYDADNFERSGSLRKPKNRETSSSSQVSSNGNSRHTNDRRSDTRGVPNEARRSRRDSDRYRESRRESERCRESDSEDCYRDKQRRSRSADRSRRRSGSRSRRRDDYYDDYESDSDYHYRDERGRSRSADRRTNRSPDRRPSSRHRSRSDFHDDYRSDDSFIRGSRRHDNRSGYKSDNRYDTRGSYRRDKRDGYRSDNRYDNRGGYRSDNRSDRGGYRSDNRYDYRERSGSFRDRRSRTASRDRSDSYRSRATSSSRYDRY